MEPIPKRFRSEDAGVHGSSPWTSDTGGGKPDCKLFNTPEGCPYGAGCRFRHVASDGKELGQQGMLTGGRRKPCTKFFSTSGCPFGESCHFSHYVPGGLAPLGMSPIASTYGASPVAFQRKPAAPTGDPSVAVNGFKTKMCNRFNTPEGCRFGDRCHFAHGESDLRGPSNFSRGENKKFMTGPRTGSHGFNNVVIDSSAQAGSISNMNIQGSSEPHPPHLTGNGDSSYHLGSSRSIVSNSSNVSLSGYTITWGQHW